MDIRKYVGINQKIRNVIWVAAPYRWIIDPTQNQGKKNRAVFLGNDMKGFLFAIDKDRYVEKVNQCLDYIRRECADCELFYKPHPADSEESRFLNLRGFQIVNEKTNGEIFLWKNWGRIKHVFAVNSAATLSAYSMGIDSHVFADLFKSIYGKTYESVKDCFLRMPQSFFIKDLGRKFAENKITLKRDQFFEKSLLDLFPGRNGDLWLTVSASEFIVALIAISRFIKNTLPGVKTHLVIWRHHRWNSINADFIKEFFDDVIYFPRIYYSLKPQKLWGTLKIARAVKRLKIKPGDVIISGSQAEFLENCFLSYFEKNKKISLLLNRDIWMNYDFDNTVFSKNREFRFSKASFFYNKIWEPLLGLNKSLYLTYSHGPAFQIVRYQKPVNEIFDHVYILN